MEVTPVHPPIHVPTTTEVRTKETIKVLNDRVERIVDEWVVYNKQGQVVHSTNKMVDFSV